MLARRDRVRPPRGPTPRLALAVIRGTPGARDHGGIKPISALITPFSRWGMNGMLFARVGKVLSKRRPRGLRALRRAAGSRAEAGPAPRPPRPRGQMIARSGHPRFIPAGPCRPHGPAVLHALPTGLTLRIPAPLLSSRPACRKRCAPA